MGNEITCENLVDKIITVIDETFQTYKRVQKDYDRVVISDSTIFLHSSAFFELNIQVDHTSGRIIYLLMVLNDGVGQEGVLSVYYDPEMMSDDYNHMLQKFKTDLNHLITLALNINHPLDEFNSYDQSRLDYLLTPQQFESTDNE